MTTTPTATPPTDAREALVDLALSYRMSRDALADCVRILENEIADVRARRMTVLKQLITDVRVTEQSLRGFVEGHPEMFESPRSQILHGVKVGYEKGKGRLEWSDAARVVDRIRKLMPDEFESLVKTSWTPIKGALAQLTAQELRKIEVQVVDTGDQVIVRDTESDAARIVEALLKQVDDEVTV